MSRPIDAMTPVIMKPTEDQVIRATEALKAILDLQKGERVAIPLLAEIIRRTLEAHAVQINVQPFKEGGSTFGVCAERGECLHRATAQAWHAFELHVPAMMDPCESPTCVMRKKELPEA
jgi:hypothetical protein